MKISGKIVLGGLKLPANLPVAVDTVEIDYESHFSIQEAGEFLTMIEKIPDIMANVYRKIMQYEKEFDEIATEKVQTTVQDVLKDIKQFEQESKE